LAAFPIAASAFPDLTPIHRGVVELIPVSHLLFPGELRRPAGNPAATIGLDKLKGSVGDTDAWIVVQESRQDLNGPLV